MSEEMEKLRAERDQLRAQVVQLREALAPFASEFGRRMAHSGRNSTARRKWNDKMPDSFPIQLKLTMGNCRDAQQALSTPAPAIGTVSVEPPPAARREDGTYAPLPWKDTPAPAMVLADKARVLAEALQDHVLWADGNDYGTGLLAERGLEVARELGLLEEKR